MAQLNLNIFNFNSSDISSKFFDQLSPVGTEDAGDALSSIFSDFADLFDNLGGSQLGGDQNISQGGCCTPPIFGDHCHPSGSLQTNGSVITTPGGYKIESNEKFGWTITGPDGKTTKVWGDPHVAEGDGGKWDFKRDSTFVLGDGTKINVSTTPYGNGATVTSNLEIISGNDRVNISGIDKGAGNVGEITHDGYSHTNSFGGKDVFVMGKESDDWSYQGREITGSSNQGESFNLGKNLEAGNTPVRGRESDWMKMIHQFVNDITGKWDNSWKPNRYGSNPYYTGAQNGNYRGNLPYDRLQHRRETAQAFHLVGRMFNVLGRMASWENRMYASRNRAMFA